MALSNEEITHLREFEETRFAIRSQIEAAHKSVPTLWGKWWSVLNSSFFITIFAGGVVTGVFSGLENQRAVKRVKESAELAVKSATLETRLKLLEQDRAFFTYMTKEVRSTSPDRARLLEALTEYRFRLLKEYEENLTDQDSTKDRPISLPGLDALLQLATTEESETAEKEWVAQRTAQNVLGKETVPDEAKTLGEIFALRLGRSPLSDAEITELKPIIQGVSQLPAQLPMPAPNSSKITEAIQKFAKPISANQRQESTRVFEALGSGTVRLFVHAKDETQAAEAQQWIDRLLEKQPEVYAFGKVLLFSQVGLESYSGQTEVRYEGAEVKSYAEELLNELTENVLSPNSTVTLAKVEENFKSGYERQIEVWLNNDATFKPVPETP